MQQSIRYVLVLGVLLAMAAGIVVYQRGGSKPAPAELSHAEPKGKFFGAMETEYPSWFNDGFLDFREDVAAASRVGKRVMILFTQNGCPYCNAVVERNLAQKDIEDLVRSKFDVIAINMWGDRNVTHVDGKSYTEKSFAEALQVQFTPTILFFNEKGDTILRLNGYLPPDKFKIALNYIAEKKEQQSYRDYVEAHAPPSQSGNLNKQTFFLAAPYNLTRKTNDKAKPIAVFFEQKDCPNCDTLHQKILPDEETRKIIALFDTIQLDMWSDTPVTTPDGKTSTARNWAKQLDVKYAPTIVVFNEEGKEIIRTEAFFKTFHTQGIFAYVLSGSYKQQPSFQRYLSNRAEHLREQGIDVDIWSLSDDALTQKK